jgi:hypothetical protein
MLLEKIVDKFDDKLMSVLIMRNMLSRWGLLNVTIVYVYSQVLDIWILKLVGYNFQEVK